MFLNVNFSLDACVQVINNKIHPWLESTKMVELSYKPSKLYSNGFVRLCKIYEDDPDYRRIIPKDVAFDEDDIMYKLKDHKSNMLAFMEQQVIIIENKYEQLSSRMLSLLGDDPNGELTSDDILKKLLKLYPEDYVDKELIDAWHNQMRSSIIRLNDLNINKAVCI